MNLKKRSIWTDLLELFFPRLCVCCTRRLIQTENHICIYCMQKLPYTDHINKNNINGLENRLIGRFSFEKASSLLYYEKDNTTQQIIHEIKYKNNPSLGIYIGELAGEILKVTSFISEIDLLVPIPLHQKRLKKRGYNQAILIAKGIADETGISINSTNLVRVINNTTQTMQSRKKRWKNVENIFQIISPSVFDGKHILIIDDVITTGATIESCCRLILSKCPNSKVSIYSIGLTV